MLFKCVVILEKRRGFGAVAHERHESHVSQLGDCFLWVTSSQISPPFKILVIQKLAKINSCWNLSQPYRWFPKSHKNKALLGGNRSFTTQKVINSKLFPKPLTSKNIRPDTFNIAILNKQLIKTLSYFRYWDFSRHLQCFPGRWQKIFRKRQKHVL